MFDLQYCDGQNLRGGRHGLEIVSRRVEEMCDDNIYDDAEKNPEQSVVGVCSLHAEVFIIARKMKGIITLFFAVLPEFATVVNISSYSC